MVMVGHVLPPVNQSIIVQTHLSQAVLELAITLQVFLEHQVQEEP